MTRKDLEYCINLVDKAAVGFKSIHWFWNKFFCGKLPPSTITCYRKIIHGRKCQLMRQTSLLSCFKNLPHTSLPSATSTLVSQESLTLRQDRKNSLKVQIMLALLTVRHFCYKHIHCFLKHNIIVHLIDYSIKYT